MTASGPKRTQRWGAVDALPNPAAHQATALDGTLPVSALMSPTPDNSRPKQKQLFYPSASSSLSHTASGRYDTVIYHLITPHLALLAVLPTAVFESRRGLVEYNMVFFREGVQEICEVEEEARRVGP